MTARDERRRHARIALACPVRVQRGEQRLEGRLVDLSLGGASLRAPAETAYALGERISLEIDLPGLEETVAVDAFVRWVDAIDTARIGVQFATGLRPREVYAVNQLVRRQEG